MHHIVDALTSTRQTLPYGAFGPLSMYGVMSVDGKVDSGEPEKLKVDLEP